MSVDGPGAPEFQILRFHSSFSFSNASAAQSSCVKTGASSKRAAPPATHCFGVVGLLPRTCPTMNSHSATIHRGKPARVFEKAMRDESTAQRDSLNEPPFPKDDQVVRDALGGIDAGRVHWRGSRMSNDRDQDRFQINTDLVRYADFFQARRAVGL